MKRIVCILLIVISVLPFFTACQKDPESPIVVNKVGGVTEQELLEEQEKPFLEPSSKTWIEELESKDGEIHIHVNAEINLPEKTEMPVVYARPHAFTEEEVEMVMKQLFGNEQLYNGAYFLDKQQLEKEILAWRADIESLKTNGTWSEISIAGSPGTMAVDVEEELKWAEENLKEAEEQFANAPERIPEFKKCEFIQMNGYRSFSVRNGDQIPATLGVNITDDTDSSYMEYRDWQGITYQTNAALDADASLDIGISKESAQTIATEFIQNIGLDCSVTMVWKVTSEYKNSAYLFTFSRNIEGIPCQAVVDAIGGAYGVDGEEYRQPWKEERIEVMVSEEGIIGFEWEDPPEMIDTINENVSLQTYDEIITIAKKLLPMQFSKEVLDEKSRDITICEVLFNMMHVAKRDTENEYYYIPVWDFIGYFGDGAGDHGLVKRSFLTINAIDGTIIHRNQNY